MGSAKWYLPASSKGEDNPNSESNIIFSRTRDEGNIILSRDRGEGNIILGGRGRGEGDIILGSRDKGRGEDNSTFSSNNDNVTLIGGSRNNFEGIRKHLEVFIF